MFFRRRNQRDSREQAADGPGIHLTVLYSGVESTIESLRKAQELATGLNAHVLVVIPMVVPFPLPIEEPPVSGEHLVRRLTQAAGDLSMRITICLARDYDEACRRAIPARSLVVLGGKRRRWQLGERRQLARKLESAGHEVVFAGV